MAPRGTGAGLVPEFRGAPVRGPHRGRREFRPVESEIYAPPNSRCRWSLPFFSAHKAVKRWWSPAAGFRRSPKPCPGRPWRCARASPPHRAEGTSLARPAPARRAPPRL